MGDFHQLALQFVLTDDKDAHAQIADKAATLIKTSPTNTHPVVRWVESIRPWMPGQEDSEMGDGEGSKGDIIARARALEFLSSTLERLAKDALVATQIRSLIAFFGAMFSVDHKAGILASAKSLTTISSMKLFPPPAATTSSKVCAMGADFTKQVAETRLAIFSLFQRLVSDPRVTRDLKQRHGDCDFVIFAAFSAYFPISLRTSRHPSGITPADLKVALRACFAAHDRVVPHSIPYLIQKLNQGDGVTVDVKLDILRTVKECVVRCKDPAASVEPYVAKIWNCLKYEVRNGEVTESINTTLECTDDLSNPTFAENAGKLLVCAASASPGAFVLILAPTVKHAVEDLRHARARDHKRDLLALLNAVLEVRSLMVGGAMELTPEDREAMKATEPILHSLYDDAYKPNLHADAVVSKKAVEGMGLLASQSSVVSSLPDAPLLSEEAGDAIASTLVDLLTDRVSDVADEVVLALQKIVMVRPEVLDAILRRVVEVTKSLGDGATTTTIDDNHDDDDSVDYLVQLTSRLAFIACSELPKKPESAFVYFSKLASHLLSCLDDAVAASDTVSRTWSVYPAALQSAMRYFREALDARLDVDVAALEFDASVTADGWAEQDFEEAGGAAAAAAPEELYNRFFLISLQLARRLYRQSTRLVDAEEGGPGVRLVLEEKLTKKGAVGRAQYLYLVSSIATLTIGQMSEAQQSRLRLHEDAVTLFRGRDRVGGAEGTEYRDVALVPVQDVAVYAQGDVENLPPQSAREQRFPLALSPGILQPLYPKVAELLFERGFGHEFLTSKLLASSSPVHDPYLGHLLLILANKHKVEGIPKVLALLEHQLAAIASGGPLLGSSDSTSTATPARVKLVKDAYAVVAGILRRYTGTSLKSVFPHLLEGPANEELGQFVAREFDALFRPHPSLAKEFHAVVKPLWSQKAYYQLVKPLLPRAWPRKNPGAAAAVGSGSPSSSSSSELICANYSIAVLSAVRHLDFSVYQDDAAPLIRLILCALRSLPDGSADVETALRALETVVRESSPTTLEPFLKSLLDACTAVVAGSGPRAADLPWMPEGYSSSSFSSSTSSEALATAARCRNLAVRLLGYLPGRFDNRRLLASAPRMERLLSVACGDRVREVRKTALAARLAWAKIE
ncbi:unnamed protein product [Parascedosporium putredinis]|uniref:MMS19 nucleotide excision repair protein n=1 Tax=Parascedosporium putredinis TaxID=1442378 RepID=A0A9P1H0G9_9PEZI|nr:unnamed protein product [Parascedosporium putredinis]CAI7992819.1 unnamed protein product [Parascedosporium putredinis]